MNSALLPMSEAMEKLPRYAAQPAILEATGTDIVQIPNESVKIATQIAAQSGVRLGQAESQPVTDSGCGDSEKNCKHWAKSIPGGESRGLS